MGALCSAATAAILHCYSDGHGKHRDVFRSKYLGVFDFIFGNTGAPPLPPSWEASLHSNLIRKRRYERCSPAWAFVNALLALL